MTTIRTTQQAIITKAPEGDYIPLGPVTIDRVGSTFHVYRADGSGTYVAARTWVRYCQFGTLRYEAREKA